MTILKQYPIPYISTPYKHVYVPQEDIYLGVNTPSFRYGETYSHWIVNDFTVIKHNGKIHAFGITHPKPNSYIDPFHYDGQYIHEAEYQLFHAVYEGTDFASLYDSGHFIEQPKILYPSERPREREECWAPCVMEKDGKFYMFYSPEGMRLAISEDLYHWKPAGTLFNGMGMMRDPYIYMDGDTYYMAYVEDKLKYRTSKDLLHWSEPEVLQESMFGATSAQESPCLFRYEGNYYLIWCICDGLNGSYDNRTFVFASDSITDFTGKSPLAILPGHAPEIYFEGDDCYIMSVFHPENGLNLAKISWM